MNGRRQGTVWGGSTRCCYICRVHLGADDGIPNLIIITIRNACVDCLATVRLSDSFL